MGMLVKVDCPSFVLPARNYDKAHNVLRALAENEPAELYDADAVLEAPDFLSALEAAGWESEHGKAGVTALRYTADKAPHDCDSEWPQIMFAALAPLMKRGQVTVGYDGAQAVDFKIEDGRFIAPGAPAPVLRGKLFHSESIPGALRSAAHVHILTLHNKSLTDLPESMRSLKVLEKLDLTGNLMVSLPEWLGELPLRALNLWLCRDLKTLPESLLQCPLEALNVGETGLKSLPTWLTRSGVSELVIGFNGVVAPPPQGFLDVLREMRSLEVLEIRPGNNAFPTKETRSAVSAWNAALAAFPFDALPNLKVLEIGGEVRKGEKRYRFGPEILEPSGPAAPVKRRNRKKGRS